MSDNLSEQEEMDEGERRTTYSHSRLDAFQICPRKYQYAYVDRIRRGTTSVEQFLGSWVHKALEKLYRDLLRGRLPELDELISFYEQAWERKWSDQILIVREEYSAENYREAGRQCLERYYRAHHPFQESATIALEHRIQIRVGEDGYRLTGFIDRLAQREDGTYEIHDYKTSESLPTQEQAEEDIQLPLYELGVRQAWPDIENVELIWHYLRSGEKIVVRKQPEDLATLEAEVVRRIEEIEAATEFPTQQSDLCDWCEYQDICPECKHAELAANLPPEEFLAEDGVKLVNEYAEVDAKLKELGARKEELKDSLVAYSEQHGVTAIVGSDFQVRVKPSCSFTVPDANKETVYDLLKQHDKWEEVSALSSSKLNSRMRSGEWEDELVNRVKDLVQEQETFTCRLSRLREREE